MFQKNRNSILIIAGLALLHELMKYYLIESRVMESLLSPGGARSVEFFITITLFMGLRLYLFIIVPGRMVFLVGENIVSYRVQTKEQSSLSQLTGEQNEK